MAGGGGGRMEREAGGVSAGRLRVQFPPFSFAQAKDVHVIQTCTAVYTDSIQGVFKCVPWCCICILINIFLSKFGQELNTKMLAKNNNISGGQTGSSSGRLLLSSRLAKHLLLTEKKKKKKTPSTVHKSGCCTK